MKIKARMNWHKLLPILPLLVPSMAGANPITEGNARFTVITPECIRIEYAGDGKFIDARSLFAVEREARSEQFELKRENGTVTIDTGVIRLRYKPDDHPLNAENLSAEIVFPGGGTTWTPGSPNPGNLGGTIRTLDQVRGPVDLGEGLLSRDGWYVIDDSKTPLLTDTWVESRPENSGSDWYLFGYGHDYKAALESLITIGGRAPMPRRYLLGTWFSRYWPFSADDYREIVKEYHDHDFPLDIIVMDMDWHRDGWTGWSWNRDLLPDPEGLLAWFHEQGLQVTLNLHPADGVAPHEDQYKSFMKELGADPSDGQTVPFDAGSETYINALTSQVLRPLLEDGVDFWWLDWQQEPFTKSIPDLTNLFWLNHELFQNTRWQGERGTSFSRWAGWGDHRHVIHFSGDSSTDWSMLGFEVPFTSTAGNVGCYFWSHDIGGHQGSRNDESYARWTQFGALTAALRSHSTRDKDLDRRPWLHPKWAEDAMRKAFHLRAELMPYVYSSAWQTHRTGISLNRPLYLEYPDEEVAYHNGQEFLFGDHLLAAPISAPGTGPARVGSQTVWFPQGDTWFDFFTGERFEGGRQQVVCADIDEFPLYVRGGVPIPLQPYSERPGTAALETLRIRCYPGTEGRRGEYALHEDDGRTDEYLEGRLATTRLGYQRKGDHVSIGIGASQGSFKGQPTSRAYVIELASTLPATEITVNGRPAKSTYDPKLAVNRIQVPATDIRKPVVVEMTAPDADPKALARQARSRRLAGLGSSPGPAAVLALDGVGLMPYHESPTFHGDDNEWIFIAPPGAIEGNRVKVVTESSESGSVVEQVSNIELGSNPVILDAGRYGRVEFRMDGKDHVLETGSLPMSGNLAVLAKVSASSSEDGHSPSDVVDGQVGGYPEHPDQEWSAFRQTTGASLKLDWDAPQAVRRIVLYDRPNTTDQVTSGIIRFSDGSTLEFGDLVDNASAPLALEFPEKTTTSVTVEITGVKPGTENAGFAEIGVY